VATSAAYKARRDGTRPDEVDLARVVAAETGAVAAVVGADPRPDPHAAPATAPPELPLPSPWASEAAVEFNGRIRPGRSWAPARVTPF
jgi:hypothetical protein